jgi:type I restriction enzyme, S subunit
MDGSVTRGADDAREGLWLLPKGWCWTPLTNALDNVTTTDPKREYGKEVFQYIDLGAIQEGKIVKPQFLAGLDAPSRARQVVNSGDTVFSCVRVYLQNIALVGEGLTSPVASTAFCVLRPSKAIDAGYLNYFVRSRRFIEWIIPLQRGNSPPAVVDSDVKAQPIPLAPLAEQRRIVARVDALFAEIAEGEAALTAARKGLDTFRRALLKAAVTGELTKDWRETNPVTETGHDLLERIAKSRAAKSPAKGRGRRADDAPPLDTSALPALPEGWAWGTLGDLSWASSYGTSTKCDALASGPPVLRIPNIRAGVIVYGDMKFATADLGLESADYVKPGDLLIIRTNGSETLIGRGGVAFDAPSKPTYFASYLIRFRLLGGELVWNWISTFFESSTVRSWMTGQIASSAGQYNVSQTNLAQLPVPIPPPAETAEILRRVSEALSAAADTMAMLDAEAADAARLKQSILKAAFEGRLVPQDPADEPASATLARLRGTPSPVTPARRGRRTKT